MAGLKPVAAALLAAAMALPTLLSCSTNRHALQRQSWMIHVPDQWRLLEIGPGGAQSFAVYTREPLRDRNNHRIVPTCMISTVIKTNRQDIGQHALDEQSHLLASMALRGYRLSSFRKDIQKDLARALSVRDMVALVCEYRFEDVASPFISIAVFAVKGGNYLTVTIESTADTYEALRHEIHEIVSSIR